jgi:hypothetical protein
MVMLVVAYLLIHSDLFFHDWKLQLIKRLALNFKATQTSKGKKQKSKRKLNIGMFL